MFISQCNAGKKAGGNRGTKLPIKERKLLIPLGDPQAVIYRSLWKYEQSWIGEQQNDQLEHFDDFDSDTS
ncbi:hypothetical protein KIN20_025489 [Parelaphostrongylus tenuis]|uniref:Uncharacterized protein n=1 Tax=Parelaphostrongylus tenuis TaxID=148309 RepID=A0AAD5QWN8_PARTN|nr:hypothetical protein KIN20_025489 [Parelaphostrongylus tenuis]